MVGEDLETAITRVKKALFCSKSIVFCNVAPCSIAEFHDAWNTYTASIFRTGKNGAASTPRRAEVRVSNMDL
jgi:hypothetical protein